MVDAIKMAAITTAIGSPVWYRIPEIAFRDYVRCTAMIYEVLEQKNKSSGDDDIFLKTIMLKRSGLTQEQWLAMEHARRCEKALTMKLGDFHEELAGKLPGYVTLPTGHETGCDVMKRDGSEVWEFKNRDNTMNSSSAESVVGKLTKAAASGKKAYLVLVNCNKKSVPRFKAPEAVQVLTGKQAYAYMSGRESFWEDLMATFEHTFATYPTYKDLEAQLV
jgi:hypothetical protein